jgi:hypothetical protein
MEYEEPQEIKSIRKVVNAVLNKIAGKKAFVSEPSEAQIIICMRYDDYIQKLRENPDFPRRSDLSIAAAPVCSKCFARVVMVDRIFEHFKENPTKEAMCNYCAGFHFGIQHGTSERT